jgi:hypothetical protein
VVLGVAEGEKGREAVSLWIVFVHGLLLGFLLASIGRLFEKIMEGKK